MKECTKCNEIKPLTEFHKRSNTKVGVQPICKVCKKEKSRERYLEKREHILAKNREWSALNSEHHSYLKERYAKSEGGKKASRLKAAKYRAKKLSADLGYCCKDIYSSCPEGYEVDHIVPLQGINVSGLHVPWNLQYLTVTENRSKGNRYA